MAGLTESEREIALAMARHVVGPGNDARERLRARAVELGVTDMETWTGISDADWDEMLRMAQTALDEEAQRAPAFVRSDTWPTGKCSNEDCIRTGECWCRKRR